MIASAICSGLSAPRSSPTGPYNRSARVRNSRRSRLSTRQIFDRVACFVSPATLFQTADQSVPVARHPPLADLRFSRALNRMNCGNPRITPLRCVSCDKFNDVFSARIRCQRLNQDLHDAVAAKAVVAVGRVFVEGRIKCLHARDACLHHLSRAPQDFPLQAAARHATHDPAGVCDEHPRARAAIGGAADANDRSQRAARAIASQRGDRCGELRISRTTDSRPCAFKSDATA